MGAKSWAVWLAATSLMLAGWLAFFLVAAVKVAGPFTGWQPIDWVIGGVLLAGWLACAALNAYVWLLLVAASRRIRQ